MRFRIIAIVIMAQWVVAGAVLHAQQTTNELPTGLTVMVLPPTGDSATVAPVAQLNTPVSGASAACNQPQVPSSSTPIVNPKFVIVDDPFNAGRTCRVPFPTGLPEGSFRAVALWTTAATTCDIGGAPRTPCVSDRSGVAIPPFSIQNVKLGPAAPTGVLITR